MTDVTGFSRRERDQEVGERPLEEKLDAARIHELAKWWSMRIRQLPDADQVRKELRGVLAEVIQESALDTEVDRVVRTADMSLEEILRNTQLGPALG